MKPVAGLKIERALICSIAEILAVGRALPHNSPILPAPVRREGPAMKFGMNLLLWSTHVTAEHFPLLARLKETGYDGVEIPLFQGDEAHFKKIGQELKKLGLASTTVTCCGADNNPVSPDAAVRKKAIEHHKWAIAMTAAMGGTHMAGPYHSALG